MARLTVSVTDETLERLRIMAGGERKVGNYLDNVTAWLWEMRDKHGATPLTEMKLVDSDEEVRRMLAQVENDRDAIEVATLQLRAMMQRQAKLEELISGRLGIDLSQLETQEGSGKDDA